MKERKIQTNNESQNERKKEAKHIDCIGNNNNEDSNIFVVAIITSILSSSSSSSPARATATQLLAPYKRNNRDD